MTTLTEKLAALTPNLVQEADDFVDFQTSSDSFVSSVVSA